MASSELKSAIAGTRSGCRVPTGIFYCIYFYTLSGSTSGCPPVLPGFETIDPELEAADHERGAAEAHTRPDHNKG